VTFERRWRQQPSLVVQQRLLLNAVLTRNGRTSSDAPSLMTSTSLNRPVRTRMRVVRQGNDPKGRPLCRLSVVRN